MVLGMPSTAIHTTSGLRHECLYFMDKIKTLMPDIKMALHNVAVVVVDLSCAKHSFVRCWKPVFLNVKLPSFYGNQILLGLHILQGCVHVQYKGEMRRNFWMSTLERLNRGLN